MSEECEHRVVGARYGVDSTWDRSSRLRLGWSGAVFDVDVESGKAELFIQSDRGLVLSVNVKHDVMQPQGSKVSKSGEGERPTEA